MASTTHPLGASRYSTGRQWRDRACELIAVDEFDAAAAAAREGMAGATLIEFDAMRTILLTSLCRRERYQEALDVHRSCILQLESLGRHQRAELEGWLGLGLYGRVTPADLEELELEMLRIESGSTMEATLSGRVRRSLAWVRVRSGVTEGVRELLAIAQEELNRHETYHEYLGVIRFRIRVEREGRNFASALGLIGILLALQADRGTQVYALLERARIHAFWGENEVGARVADEAVKMATESELWRQANQAASLAATLRRRRS